jgi:hypothetical protein
MAPSKNRNTDNPNIGSIVESLILECRNPGRLLELYYWSTEPELLPVIRGIAALPVGTRVQLEAFLHASGPGSVSAVVESDGHLRLTAKDVRAFAKMSSNRRRHAA